MERFFKRKEPSSGPNFVDLNSLPWDPADRIRILDYHPDQRDEIRRRYWINGPCQPRGHHFPPKVIGNKDRHFNRDWFDKYGNWLEYSVKADKAFCLCCYLFADSVGNQGGRDAFVKEGFGSWNKPERLAVHIGDINSAHNKALKKCNDLLNQKQSIVTALHKQDDIVKRANRMRLNATIDDIRLCLKGALAFRAHNESKTSPDKGNFLEVMAVIVKHDKELRELPKAAGLTDILSRALQRKDQDIVEAVLLVETTKEKLKEFRENGFDRLLEKVGSFCEKHDIQIPDMLEEYVNDRAKRRRYNITYQHYYKFDCFNTVVDMQIQEFGDRFSEISTELLRNVPALNPRDSFAMFDATKLMRLSEFYPYDFDEEEKVNLESQLEVYIASVQKDERFANLNGIADLARVMVETRKHVYFPLIYRLLKLVLVLPVATATVERCFSALKIVKTSLRNRIGEDFLNACVICSVEKETLENITNEAVIDRFQKMKPRRGQL